MKKHFFNHKFCDIIVTLYIIWRRKVFSTKTIDKNVVMLGWVSFFTDMASAMINPIAVTIGDQFIV